MSKLEDVLSKLVPGGSTGEDPSHWAIFCNFLEKSYFNATGSHFARIQSYLKEQHF